MERYRFRANYNSKPSSHISLPPKPPPISSYLQPQTPRPKPDDAAEISIFDAQRYFNEGQGTDKALNKKKAIIHNGFTDPRDSSWVSSVDEGRNYSKNRSFRAPPTASSEASWNSQTGLLANRPGSVAVSVKAYPLNENKKGSRRNFFGRNCPCYGKKSVDVEERSSGTRTPARGSIGIENTETETESVEEVAKVKIWASEKFPTAEISRRIVNSAGGGGGGNFSFPVMPPEEPARESLEVFRPGELATTSPRNVPDDDDNDAMSDTSSDLFEIESFSANPAALFRCREPIDDMPKVGSLGISHLMRNAEEVQMVPSECYAYAPSEVSVEWSVTTAEGRFDRTSVANFSSSASEFGDNRFFPADSMVGNGGGEAKKRGGGGLLNCRREKAVSVGPNPVRLVPDQQHQRVPTGPGSFSARVSRK